MFQLNQWLPIHSLVHSVWHTQHHENEHRVQIICIQPPLKINNNYKTIHSNSI